MISQDIQYHHFPLTGGTNNRMKDSKLGMVGRGGIVYDGKRMRKAIHRKVLDYSSTIIQLLEKGHYERDYRDYHTIQPVADHIIDYLPPSCYLHNPSNAITTKYMHTSTNKVRCPVNVVRVCD